MAFNPDGEPVDIVNHFVNFGWEYVYHCHILSHEEMDMMHAQVVGVAPAAPDFGSCGRQRKRQQPADTRDLDRQLEERDGLRHRARLPARPAPGPSSRRCHPRRSALCRSYDRHRRRDRHEDLHRSHRQHEHLYEYQVYAINVVGDIWDYSNPAFNDIPPGGGWPTLTLSLAGWHTPVVVAIAALPAWRQAPS